MKKKLALILACVAVVIAIIVIAFILREKEQPIDPPFPEEGDTVPSGFSHIDSVLEKYDLSYVFWETQISILDKANVCIYQTDASDSSFIVECNGEYYINESIIENAVDINVTEPAVTTAPAQTTEQVEEDPLYPTVEPSSVETVNALPAGTEAALLEGGPVGGIPRFYVFDAGLTYYVSEIGDYSDITTRKYSKCELSLPDGYTNGTIVKVEGGGGSGEAFITVAAEKDGSRIGIEYYFFSDNIAVPVSVRVLGSADDIPPVELVRVLYNNGAVDVHAVRLPLENENTRTVSFKYSDRYSVYVTYEVLKNDASGFLQRSHDMFVVDALRGEIVYSCALDTEARPNTVEYTDDGCIIYDVENTGSGYRVNCAYKVTEQSGEFLIAAVDIEPYPKTRERFVSPDGTYTAYETEEDGWNNGGIDVKYPDGSVKRILENVMLGDTAECKAKSIQDVTGYTVVGFIDDTHLAYYIGGWEWIKGYGIYDLASDKNTEYKGTYDPIAVHDGALFIEERNSNGDGTTSVEAVYKVTVDGEKTKLVDTEYGMLSDSIYATFKNSMWCRFESSPTDDSGRQLRIHLDLSTPGFDEPLAEIEYFYVSSDFSELLIYENSVTVVFPDM